MADGTGKPIEQVEVGDEVLATDPETGETGGRTVVATIAGQGRKDLVELTIDTDGPTGDETGTVIATAAHPVWVPGQDRWLDTSDLRPGDELRTRDNTQVTVQATESDSRYQTVHNLTIAGIHTYYVLAGNTPVLVHNSGGDWCTPEERIEDAANIGNGHAGSKHAGDFPGYSPKDIGDLARDVMQNPARTKSLGGGRRAYQGKDGSTIVIHDPMHPDGGTIFRRDLGTIDDYWDGLN
jgi:hypothetical protein